MRDSTCARPQGSPGNVSAPVGPAQETLRRTGKRKLGESQPRGPRAAPSPAAKASAQKGQDGSANGDQLSIWSWDRKRPHPISNQIFLKLRPTSLPDGSGAWRPQQCPDGPGSRSDVHTGCRRSHGTSQHSGRCLLALPTRRVRTCRFLRPAGLTRPSDSSCPFSALKFDSSRTKETKAAAVGVAVASQAPPRSPRHRPERVTVKPAYAGGAAAPRKAARWARFARSRTATASSPDDCSLDFEMRCS
ncbi:hypothetical protein CB1_000287027 [Camelus ferus]|nr:hypothetical protein CB1_000287027 [Camelus ferus]